MRSCKLCNTADDSHDVQTRLQWNRSSLYKSFDCTIFPLLSLGVLESIQTPSPHVYGRSRSTLHQPTILGRTVRTKSPGPVPARKASTRRMLHAILNARSYRCPALVPPDQSTARRSLFALLSISHIPFPYFLHLRSIGAITYRSLPVSLRPRHLEQQFGDILDLAFGI